MCEKPSVMQNANAEEISSVKTKKSSGKSGSKRAASVTAEIGQDACGMKKVKKTKKLSAALADDAAAEPKTSPGKPGSKQAATPTAEVRRPRMTKRRKKLSAGVAEDAVAMTPTPPQDAAGKDEKENKNTSRVVQRVWSKEDEIVILKGIYEYRAKTGSEPSSDSAAFFEFIKGSFRVQVSRNQLMDKVRSLKKKFFVNTEKSSNGEDPSFSKPHDLKAFKLSKEIWGKRGAAEETQALNKSNSNGNVECEVFATDELKTEDGGGARMRRKKKKPPVAFVGRDANVDITSNPAALLGNEESSVGSFQRRLWTMFDEIRLLKGVCEFREKTGPDAGLDSDAFFDFIQDCFLVQPSKKELMYKLGWMKNNFLQESKRGTNPSFSYAHASTVFELSKKIWGNGEGDEETHTLNNSNAKGNLECEGTVVKYVSKPEVGGNRTEEIIEEENERKDMERIDGDEFCARYPYLLAAVETIVTQRMLGEFPKRVLLEELLGFCGDKVREWDNKWKALLFEEMKLQTAKLKLVAELSDAAF